MVGNPPYVRQERFPQLCSASIAPASTRFTIAPTLYVLVLRARARSVEVRRHPRLHLREPLAQEQVRGPLRNKIASGIHVTHFIDMEGVDAFHADVIAYPAITIIRRPALPGVSALPTRIAARGAASAMALGELSERLASPAANDDAVQQVMLGGYGDAPWLFDDEPRLALLRRSKRAFHHRAGGVQGRHRRRHRVATACSSATSRRWILNRRASRW
ncbi:MAG: hypothetical protein IPH76_11760 [Xanthomonadales bacterium]|nr:hypothetical protein [Xanthomonadales bacterium]